MAANDSIHDVTTPYEMRSRERYVDTFNDFNEAEMQAICQVKRFIECYEGDRDFRAAVEAGGAFSDRQLADMKAIGITFDPSEMEVFWLDPGFTMRLHHLTFQASSFEELPTEIHDTLAKYPALRIYKLWQFRRAKMGLVQKRMVLTTPTVSAPYTAWRARRIDAVRNELGSYGWDIDHPCHAVEMAVGCSVGCDFCAFDAPKLATVFDYTVPENRALVRGVALGMVQQLGWPSAHGMLYWSTEPADNPHYVELLQEWEDVTGGVLCTATARAKEDWVKKLRDYYSRVPAPWPRISVLSRNIMRRLHRTFSPLELRDTTMLMQQGDAEFMRSKVPGGREKMLLTLVKSDDLRDIDIDNPPEVLDIPQGSIACVSGLLVNMVNKTMKLCSPCYTTLEYRYGYRVYDTISFDGPEDYGRALVELINRSMVSSPYPEMPIRWRDDLKYLEREDGFTLLSPTTQRDFRRGAIHRAVGALVERGDMTHNQVFEALADDHEVGPMAAAAVLEVLFNKGYLCEMAITQDYRARYLAAQAVEAVPAD
ncbi:MAG: radical SAM family RiPP maturation amino acid epimerase [Paracoccaceae bacterium]|jgi:radical SAM family RiPP maturation amino acid epimerase